MIIFFLFAILTFTSNVQAEQAPSCKDHYTHDMMKFLNLFHYQNMAWNQIESTPQNSYQIYNSINRKAEKFGIGFTDKYASCPELSEKIDVQEIKKQNREWQKLQVTSHCGKKISQVVIAYHRALDATEGHHYQDQMSRGAFKLIDAAKAKAINFIGKNGHCENQRPMLSLAVKILFVLNFSPSAGEED